MRNQILAAVFGALIGLFLFSYAHAQDAPAHGDCMTLEGVVADNPKGSVFVRLTDEEYANLDRTTHLPHAATRVVVGHLPADFDGDAKNYVYAFVFDDRGCLIARGAFEPQVFSTYLQPLPPT